MILTRLKTPACIGLVFCLVSVVFAYSGGSGTEANPYQIGSVDDWIELMNAPNDWDANFIMTADINLQGVPLTPVGDYSRWLSFKGVFDGNGHIISNATINRPGDLHIGLFGDINPYGQIRNLGVEYVNMTGYGDVAGLAGWSAGTITNCYATGKIDGGGINYGGLVGLNAGTVTGSHAACDVNGGNRIGGLVGENIATIIDSYSTGTVNGIADTIGGLVGRNRIGDISHIGTITRCYATGSVNGYSTVGGLVGKHGEPPYVCTITDCYATGAVTGNSGVGGLLGYNAGHTANCYAAGKVTGNTYVGGLVGYSIPPLINCFWDIEATGQTAGGSGTGLTTAEMKTLAPFMSAGWDFVDTWGIGENQTYPFLRMYSGADLNYDNIVNFDDFALFADRWLLGG